MAWAALGVPVASVAAVLACSSFGEAANTDAEGGATPDGEAEAATTDASTDPADASTSVCIPVAVEPSDAGEDANCEGTGAATILGESGKHCGRCGHDCLGAGCVNGVCNVVPLTTDELGSTSVTAATSTHLYYSSTSGNPSPPRYVRRLAFDDGGVEFLAIPSGTGYLHDTRIEGASPAIYTVLSDRGVLFIPTDGGSESTVVADNSNVVLGLAVDAVNLYWLLGSALWGRARADGVNASANFVIHSGTASSAATALIADGAKLYWAVREQLLDGGTTTSIRVRGPGKNDTVSVHLPAVPDVIGLAVDANFLYWSSPNGEIWRAAKATNALPELVTRVTGARRFSKGLAVDDNYVYAAMSVDSQNGTVAMSLVQAPKCGGPPRLLADDTLVGGGLIAAGGYLYWGRGFSVVRIAK